MCKAGPVNSGGHSTVLTAVAKMNTLTLGGNLLVERNQEGTKMLARLPLIEWQGQQ